MLERVEAFRGLIRHGHVLLGEVVAYCRDAEAALTQIAAEKQDMDAVRAELEQARTRAETEGTAAREALAQVAAQREELAAARRELVKARDELERMRQSQASHGEVLEQSLKRARQQQAELEQELQKVRSQNATSKAIDARLQQLDQMEAHLRATERELTATRRALEEERSRRDRAIALIKPRQAAAEPEASGVRS